MKHRFYIVLIVALAAAVSIAQQSGNEGSAPGPAQPTKPPRVRVSEKVSQALLIKAVPPKYPDAARNAGIQGVVVLKALIDKDGNVEDVTLISGHSWLAPAAIDAVKQWKYKPFLLNGEPVWVETQVTVNFTLSRG